MIKARFGTTPDTIEQINMYFDINYEPQWFDHPMVREMVKDIDKSEVITGTAISSPILDTITPRELSGGLKLLILLLFEPENEYYGTKSGDNCAPWIYKISKMHDVHLTYTHLMQFPEEITDLNIEIVNDGEIVNTMDDFFWKSMDFI